MSRGYTGTPLELKEKGTGKEGAKGLEGEGKEGEWKGGDGGKYKRMKKIAGEGKNCIIAVGG
jgi:hypothetical protein